MDYLFIGVVLFFAVLGFFRGILSQFMGILGIVFAYLLAPKLGDQLAPFVQEQTSFSLFMSEKLGLLLAGVGIYFIFRIVGFFISKLFMNQVKPFRRVNRFGGGAFGACKGAFFVYVLMLFVGVLPKKTLDSTFPRVRESVAYQLVSKDHPWADQAVLERMRKFRHVMKSSGTATKAKQDERLQKLFEKYEMKGALSDKRLLEQLEKGDYEKMEQNEALEQFMKDDQLEKLLADLEKAEEK